MIISQNSKTVSFMTTYHSSFSVFMTNNMPSGMKKHCKSTEPLSRQTAKMISFSLPSGNRTPGSRFYSDLLDTTVCIHQLVLKRRSKALGCSSNCRRLAYGSFQLTHMSRDVHAVQFNWSSHGGQGEDQTLLHLSDCCRALILTCWNSPLWQRCEHCGQNFRGPFLRATLPMTVGSCARAMEDNGKTKGLITPPPWWVSAQLLYVCVSAW